jgi:glyoxylase-like metal-dependent hydrolase (beta-lactamase superfamily II)
MGTGDVYEVGHGTDGLHYVDTGMFDIEEYSSVYIVDAERPAVVETGIGKETDLVLEALASVGIAPEDLEFVVPTHVHLDHAGGAGHLAQACPNAEVVAHENGARHLVDPSRLWAGTKRAVGDQIRHYAEPEPVPADRVVQVRDGSVVDLGDRGLHVHGAPGHAPHQAVFEDPANDALFTADAAGVYVPAHDGVYPTTPPPNFDFEQAVADTQVLSRLNPAVLCYSHFGPVQTANRLDEHVDVLTEWVETVAAAREELGDHEAVVERMVAGEQLSDAWNRDRAEAVAEMDTRGVLRYLETRES